MIKKNVNNLGFTLLELIISIAILSIVLATVYSINLFGLRSYSESDKRSDNQFDVRMTSDFISKTLRFANEVTVGSASSTTKESGYYYIYIDTDKKIKYFNGNSEISIPGVTGSDNYKLNFVKNNTLNNVLNFTIGKANTTTYDISSDVIILNQSGSILGSTGDLVKFKMSKADSIKSYTITGFNTPTLYTVLKGADFTLPSRINVNILYTAGGSSIRSVPVSWVPSSINTNNVALIPVSGTVVGYGSPIGINVNVVSDTLKSDTVLMTEEVLAGSMYSPPNNVFVETTSSGNQLVAVNSWDNYGPVQINTVTEFVGTISGYSVEGAGPTDVTVNLTVSPRSASIISVENPTATFKLGETIIFPLQVRATYDDATTNDINVTWSNTSSVNNQIPGTYIVSGTVAGYGSAVNYTVTVITNKLSTPTIVTTSINTNSKQADFSVSNAEKGATLFVKKANGTNVVNGITISNAGTATINNIKYDEISYFILEKQYWQPSDQVPFAQP